MDILIQPSPLSGEIRAISSKSDVHRALIAGALARGTTRVHFTTLSEDIAATVSVLRTLGASVTVDGADGNYTVTVCGITAVQSGVTLDANECGTTARLILPIAAALTDTFTFTGKNRLLKRPFADLCACMAQNGTACSDTLLPITASGRLHSGTYEIRGDVSSQYISGLLFALPLLDGDSEIILTSPLVSAGYIDMTLRTLGRFCVSVYKTPRGFHIPGRQIYRPMPDYIAEGDWSNAAFWLVAGVLGASPTGAVVIKGLDLRSPQRDSNCFTYLLRMGARICEEPLGVITVKKSVLHAIGIDGRDTPDLLPVMATALCVSEEGGGITHAEHLRHKESDRIATTTAMLKAIGAEIRSTEDGFDIGSVDRFIGGEVDAAGDHRIAMSAAVAAQRCVGPIIIRGAECVNKSYPTFFEDYRKLGGNYSVIHG